MLLASHCRVPLLQCYRRFLPRLATCKFTVLALESSADDTCAAVVTSSRNILSNIVLKQLEYHESYGGITPILALQMHQRNMPIAVQRALGEAKLDMSQIDGIAFTRGPGMGGCLGVSSNAAKTLASALKKPLIGVHHMQAHALTPILTARDEESMPRFPFLTLLISGGHTLLVLALSLTRFRILAATRDAAVGRVIDKVTRELHIPWNGRAPGAAFEAFCRDGEKILGLSPDELPRIEPLGLPMPGEMGFSFAGLHSAVDRYVLQYGTRSQPTSPRSPVLPSHIISDQDHVAHAATPSIPRKVDFLPGPYRLAIARAFENAVLAHLAEKVVLAIKWCKANRDSLLREYGNILEHADSEYLVKHLVMSGGVASNLFFREGLSRSLKEKFPNQHFSLLYPPPAYCTDNAAMVAWASMYRFLAGESDEYSIEIRTRWSIEELDR